MLCSVNTTQSFPSRDRPGSFVRKDFLCAQVHDCSLGVESIMAAVVVVVGFIWGQTRLHALWLMSTLAGMYAEVAWVAVGLDSALLPVPARPGGHRTLTCHAIRSLSFSIFSWASGCSCRYCSVKKAWWRQGEPLSTLLTRRALLPLTLGIQLCRRQTRPPGNGPSQHSARNVWLGQTQQTE